MAARSNAIAEITRFWLQSRHNCLVNESVPVKVFHGNSDIDLVAMRPDLSDFKLPNGADVNRIIVETKDEHDYDPTGYQMGKQLEADLTTIQDGLYIPAPADLKSKTIKKNKVKFSMLREEHYMLAKSLFGTSEFHRVFVLHAIGKNVSNELRSDLASKQKIHLFAIQEIIDDLRNWYNNYDGKPGLRHTLMGDIWHLLFGYYQFSKLKL